MNDVVLKTGFENLDQIIGGFLPGQLICLGSRVAIGKTALALSMAYQIATNPKHFVLYYSLELQKVDVSNRLLKMFGTKCIELKNLIINDSPNINIDTIRDDFLKYEKNNNPKILFIDYIQLFSSVDYSIVSRESSFCEITKNLKVLAKELNCTVVFLSQLSRGIETRLDKRPCLSDFRESACFEADSDIVMCLYRDSFYNKNSVRVDFDVDIYNGPQKLDQI